MSYVQIKIDMKVQEIAGDICTTAQQVYETWKDMENFAQETFQILTLNTKNVLIERHLITIGTVNSSLVAPMDVFKRAILDSSPAIILVHNHPSGDPTPSMQDIEITKQLIEGGKLLKINVLDHVIIGDDGRYISLRESGLCNF